MKLPIEHEYFLEIKKGLRHLDWRSPHITFIDKKTGEKCVRDIDDIRWTRRGKLPKNLDKDILFGDDQNLIEFELKEE